LVDNNNKIRALQWNMMRYNDIQTITKLWLTCKLSYSVELIWYRLHELNAALELVQERPISGVR